MTVTWTSGYNIIEAVPFVEWGLKGESQTRSPAGTLTFHRNSMCGMVHLSFDYKIFVHLTYPRARESKTSWSNSISFVLTS